MPEHAAFVFAACGAFSEYSQVIFCDLITASSDLVQTLVPEEVLQEYIYQQMSGTKGQW